jgi:parallel beta-helix repeat protein
MILSLPVLMLAGGNALAKSTSIDRCGIEIVEPGNYKLVKDLDCPGSGIWIVSSDVSLDLKGHSISCSDTDNGMVGAVIALSWAEPLKNVTIRNGQVSNCHDGVTLINVEDSKVTRIAASGNVTYGGPYSEGTGITVFMGGNNVITHNELFGNESHGLGVWYSDGNVFKHNTMRGNGNEAIWFIAGSDSLIMCNDIYGNADGIAMQYYSDGNLLQGNHIADNYFGGIWMFSQLYDPDPSTWDDIPSANTVRMNIVENNGMGDLFEAYYVAPPVDMIFPDPEGTCHNTWQKNRYGFAMAAPGCVPEPFDLEEVCALGEDDD